MFGGEGSGHFGVLIFPVGQEEVKAAASRYPVRPGGGAAANAAPDGTGTRAGLSERDRLRRTRSDPGTEFCVDIVVKGRKTEVPERFRKHVAEN